MTLTGGPARVLIVDDEPPIRRFLRTSLSAQGYVVLEAGDGAEAMDQIKRNAVDVVVLDLGLPNMHGFDVIQKLRETGADVPVIVLSSRTDEAGKVKALDLGADDYVTKPFGVDELLARIRTALRHALRKEGAEPVFASGGLKVDLARRLVTVDGAEVKLSPREYDLLKVLVANAGKVLTHKYIINEVWGTATDVQYLRLYIRALRQKLEKDPERPRHILTEQGVGYRLRGAE